MYLHKWLYLAYQNSFFDVQKMRAMKMIQILSLALFFLLLNCQQSKSSAQKIKQDMSVHVHKNLQKATLAGGCFWCIEAAYDQLKGVENVQSGYAGGHKKNPTYKEVCTIDTGHAEVVQVAFDPDIISYETLLKVFWTLHDPTQLNRQGNDIGTQYRSEIFYHDEKQRLEAEKSLKELQGSGIHQQPIVTKISALNDNFYPAEDYHTDYYELNKTQPYCSGVIAPKMQKFYKKFHEILKDEYK